MPGSLSFNNVIMPALGAGGSKTHTVQFGLYSLNGSTLSLANSASYTASFSNTTLYWFTLATSTTQDITPGNWYFGFLHSCTNTNSQGFIGIGANFVWTGEYTGGYVRGALSVTTNVLPTSIATTDFNKEGVAGGSYNSTVPQIIISA